MNAREIAVDILRKSEANGAFVDYVMADSLRNHGLSARDRALVVEIVNGTCRWRGKIDWALDQLCQKGLKSCPSSIVPVLETGLYQVMFLDRVPHYAAIDETVKLAHKLAGRRWAGVVNGVLRNFLRKKNDFSWPIIEEEPATAISILYSHPKWLVQRWLARFGQEETIRLCEVNNGTPAVSLRLSRLAGSHTNLQARLRDKVAFRESPYDENFVVLDSHVTNLAEFEPLREGLCSVQDASAGAAVRLLDPQPGDTIVDLCAAPGGKATFLGELSDNRAFVAAIDISLKRAKLVKENCERLQLKSIRVVVADGRNVVSNNVNKILVDAPCTGFGVLAKRSDLRWRRSEKDQDDLVQLQRALLDNSANILKPDGVLVYSTCTIEPEENEEVVEAFLRKHKGFEIEHAGEYVHLELVDHRGFVRTYQHRHGVDGSFAARLVKRAG